MCVVIILFNDTATTEIYTLSLHDALPIWSCPSPAWISAAMRVGICAWSTWSTTTFTPTLLPQSCANLSNQVSWLGTKWLHRRIFSSPDSLPAGSLNVVSGASPVEPGSVVGDSSLAQAPPTPAAMAATAAARNTSRRLRGTPNTRGTPLFTGYSSPSMEY